jgi:hypothetical protein
MSLTPFVKPDRRPDKSALLPAAASLLSFVAVLAFAVFACRAETPPSDAKLVEQVRSAIALLDAAEFADRERALEYLEGLIDNQGARSLLAQEVARAIAEDATSIEARSQLDVLAKRLPQDVATASDHGVSTDDIDALLNELRDNSSRTRDTAQRRLLALLDRAECVVPILQQVKQRLADPAVAPATFRALEPVLDKARGKWVQADPATMPMARMNDAQIEQWIDLVALPGDPESAQVRLRRDIANRELIDLIVRDDTRERVLAVLAKKTVDNADAEARLREIADFARPAMAAEVWTHSSFDWEHRQHVTVQHLLVDVPQYPEISTKATHFDRIDDKTAHCVSGNNLTPGDYPVGVAIPHPLPAHEFMYYLINLPTPRQRLAYEYSLRRDESTRLQEISRRTLDDFLARKHVLNERECLLLCQLDPQVVSKFVGPYFEAVGDEMLSPPLTVHATICHMLVRAGRHEAIAALEKKARSGKLGVPTAENPFAAAWAAALATARHHPWPDVDRWLFSLVDVKDLIVFIQPSGDVGSVAAAILLERRGLAPSLFGLETAGERDLDAVRLPGYQFSSDTTRAEFRSWWLKQDSAAKSVP